MGDPVTKVIEALLCAAADANCVSLSTAVACIGCDWNAVYVAVEKSYRYHPKLRYGDRLAETAYRLIESDPTLRREWFGA
jgi:hypothetical protein